jgi:hypothetical protein
MRQLGWVGLITIMALAGCTRRDQAEVRHEVRSATQEVKKDFREAGREIKNGLHDIQRDVRNSTRGEADRERHRK